MPGVLEGDGEEVQVTPTARELAYCKAQGHLAHVVERWVPYTKRRLDVYGFGDLLVVDDKQGPILVQVTITRHMNARIAKIREQCREPAERWLDAGGRISVVGWAMQGPRGGRKMWTRSMVEVWF